MPSNLSISSYQPAFGARVVRRRGSREQGGKERERRNERTGRPTPHISPYDNYTASPSPPSCPSKYHHATSYTPPPSSNPNSTSRKPKQVDQSSTPLQARNTFPQHPHQLHVSASARGRQKTHLSREDPETNSPGPSLGAGQLRIPPPSPSLNSSGGSDAPSPTPTPPCDLTLLFNNHS